MNLHENSSDRELFRRIASGDEAAFEVIFRGYLPRLKPFIMGFVKTEEVTDEILQDLFLKIWLRREDLIEIKNPLAWCYKVASNMSLDQLRRQATEYRTIKSAIENSSTDADDLFEHISAKRLQEIIHEAIERLPDQRKRIYKLTKELGWSHKMAADHLGISVQTVKNQVFNAVKAIQQHIRQATGLYIPFILFVGEINFIMP